MRLEPCVYCGSSRPPRNKREHVMPRMFGTFADSWTVDFVCDDCNAFFGEELELYLGRDSVEALQRLHTGVKKAADHRELRYDRVELVVEEPGAFQGAKVYLGPDAADGVQPVPFPQVGFRRSGESVFQWILEEDLSPETLAPYMGTGWQIMIVGEPAETRQRIVKRIQELGIKFVAAPEGGDEVIMNQRGEASVLMEATIDIPIQRALAKIAMNFAAFVIGADFMRREEFDAVRRFVRFGERPGHQVTRPSQRPVLALDSATHRQTDGHVIAVEWQGADVVAVRFSPFNFATYDIILCTRFRGLWREIAAGFVFDHQQHQIVRLASTRLVKPPWT